jgi:hypothetical protein
MSLFLGQDDSGSVDRTDEKGVVLYCTYVLVLYNPYLAMAMDIGFV